MIRYAITKLDADGLRTLATSNRGQYFKGTEEEAKASLQALLSNNDERTLSSSYGKDFRTTLQVRPLECYPNGDAKQIFFEE